MAHTGSVTQSFPSISQSGTATYPLQEILVDTVQASSNPFQKATDTLVSDVFASEIWSAISIDLLTDTVATSDTPTYEVDIPMESTVNAGDSLLGTSWTTTIAPSSFRATEKLTHSTELLFTDTTALLRDEFVGFSRNIELSSAANVIDTIDPGVIYNQLLSSTVNANDDLIPGQTESIVENITTTEELTYYTSSTELLESAASVTDTQFWSATQFEILSSTATVNESFNFEGSVYNNMLSDTVKTIDSIWAKDFNAIAWVLNTQSGGITNYDNFGFNSIAFHAGKLYATSPEGLFELGANNDDGRKIDAIAKGGFDDYGTEEKKRMSDIYVGYTGGDLECDVETYDGPEEVYTYGMEYRDADAPRNNRLKVGRGLSSRYWRLAFKNIGGADFQIYDVAVNIATSKRRL